MSLFLNTLLTSKFTFQNWLLLLRALPNTPDLLLAANPKRNFDHFMEGNHCKLCSVRSPFLLFWAHPSSMQLLHSPKSSLHATQRLKAQFIDALTHSLIRSAPASSVTDSPVYRVAWNPARMDFPIVRLQSTIFGDDSFRQNTDRVTRYVLGVTRKRAAHTGRLRVF